jgi:hypothetical protein
MNSRSLSLATLGIALLVLTVGAGAMAGPWNETPTYFSGVINDYSPASVMPPGPWEIRGPWSLKLKKGSDQAHFSAALTMELSDYTRTSSNVDSTSGTTSRMEHTHHIKIEDGTVTQISTGGFAVTGPVTILRTRPTKRLRRYCQIAWAKKKRTKNVRQVSADTTQRVRKRPNCLAVSRATRTLEPRHRRRFPGAPIACQSQATLWAVRPGRASPRPLPYDS